MNQVRADRSECIGMIGEAMFELLTIASREDLQAAVAWWASPEACNAWGAVECMRLVADRIRNERVTFGGPFLGPQ